MLRPIDNCFPEILLKRKKINLEECYVRTLIQNGGFLCYRNKKT